MNKARGLITNILSCKFGATRSRAFALGIVVILVGLITGAVVIGSLAMLPYLTGNGSNGFGLTGNPNSQTGSGNTLSCPTSALTSNQLSLINQNKAAYQAAASRAGVPWELIAGIHFRETGLSPNSSNPFEHDHLSFPNLEAAAIDAAEHAKIMVKSVYGKTLTANSDDETVKLAFLAYNRGAMYRENGCSVEQSPYVMNQYDAAHRDMRWPNSACEPPSTRGKINRPLGAFTVYKILEGCTESGPVIGPSSGACNWPNVERTGRNSYLANTPVSVTAWRMRDGTKVPVNISVNVHRFCTNQAKEIFDQIYRSPDKPVINSVGCYANRGNSFSRHQWGVACDINSNENFCVNCYAKKLFFCRGGQNVGSFWKPGDITPDKNYYGWSNGLSNLSMPINGSIAKAFADHGWGRGLYNEQYGSCYNDFMHFSLDKGH